MVKLSGIIKSNDLNHGAYEWNSNQTYNVPAMVFGSDGNVYKALKSSTNKNPINSPDVWEDIFTKLNNVINEVKMTVFPIGGICAWPSLNSFPGYGVVWFECDGSTYNTNEYPELFNVLGMKTLPDYRGIFLRRTWFLSI